MESHLVRIINRLEMMAADGGNLKRNFEREGVVVAEVSFSNDPENGPVFTLRDVEARESYIEHRLIDGSRFVTNILGTRLMMPKLQLAFGSIGFVGYQMADLILQTFWEDVILGGLEVSCLRDLIAMSIT